MMRIDVLTLFPDMFAPMSVSLMGIAQDNELIDFRLHNFRQFATNKHGHVDDYPYGGGVGMLLQVAPIVDMLRHIEPKESARIILVDPTGEPFTQQMANEWAKEEQLVFICGHYEGFDNRVRHYVTDEVSLGDYVLTNGELPTMVMIDATVRLLPEVVGNEHSIVDESHQRHLLEHPQYTRPREFEGLEVPEVLFSGHHEKIRQWQITESLRKTLLKRPDLLEKAELTQEEQAILKTLQEETFEVDKE